MDEGDQKANFPGGPHGWHSRGYLPHFEGGAIPQAVNFRLAGTLPRKVIEQWEWELRNLPDETAAGELRDRIESYLDVGSDGLLASSGVADIVENALLFLDGRRYNLHAWVVMPNHVHVLFTPFSGWLLGALVGSWKRYSSNQINKLLGVSGSRWDSEYFDRYIRNRRHFEAEVAYIEQNPVKAHLCRASEDWPHGSARLRRGN